MGVWSSSRACFRLVGALTAAWALAWAAPARAHDQAACHDIRDLVFVGHMDDDLLFMNPDLANTLREGGCLQLVYLTASDRGEGAPYMLGRERGMRAAYAAATQKPDIWSQDVLVLGTHRLARFTLRDDPRVQLIFVRIQDPWLGKGWGSLTPLSRLESQPDQAAESIGPLVERYTRPSLVELLSGLIRETQPTTVRYMDATITVPYTQLCWRCSGNDHPDHIASARLVREAMAATPGLYAQVGYLSYPSQERPSNLDSLQTARKTQVFLTYMRHDYRYCGQGAHCDRPAGPEASWVSRQYYVSDAQTPAAIIATRNGPALLTLDEQSHHVSIRAPGSAQAIGANHRSPDHSTRFQASRTRSGVLIRQANGQVLSSVVDVAGDPMASDSEWQSVTGARLIRPPAVSAGDDPWMIGMGYDGRFQGSRWDGTLQRWGAWHALPGLAGARPDAVIAQKTRTRALVLGTDEAGRVWCTHIDGQHDRGEPAVWRMLPGMRSSGGLALLANAAGGMEAYFRDASSGRMLRLVQSRAAQGCRHWGTPQDMGIVYVGQPSITRGPAGHILVAVRERDGGPLWLLENGQPRRLPGAPASDPQLSVVDGRLYVASRQIGPRQDYLVLVREQGVWRGDISPDPHLGPHLPTPVAPLPVVRTVTTVH